MLVYSLQGNGTTESFRVSLDRMVPDDNFFYLYEGHHQTRLFDVISVYSGWLACGSYLMYPYLPEKIMCLFDYIHTIQRPLYESAPLRVFGRDLGEMLDHFVSYLISKEYL